MRFHEYLTTYEWNLRTIGRSGITVGQFYSAFTAQHRSLALAGQEQAKTEHNRGLCEWEYHTNGRPYYRIFPAVLPTFLRVKIDIPCSYLRFPFKSFAILLPVEDNPLQIREGRYVRSILVSECEGRCYLWIDTNEFEHVNGVPCCVITYQQLVLDPSLTLDQSIFVLPRAIDDVSDEIIRQVVRLAVSVCFLATGSDRLVTPDVLSKDLAAWLEAMRRGDNPRREAIEQRAVRRGKKGWDVGRSLVRPESRKSDGVGHELQWQHQRGAHFRRLASGVVFVRQATVRPDLPARD
jgi:hypothetical protein